jgi:hypothetical protein
MNGFALWQIKVCVGPLFTRDHECRCWYDRHAAGVVEETKNKREKIAKELQEKMRKKNKGVTGVG